MMYLCFVTKEVSVSTFPELPYEYYNLEVIRINEHALKRADEDLEFKNMRMSNLVGTTIVSTLMTNDRIKYLKYRLEWKIKETKAYALHTQAFIKLLEERGTKPKVVEETERLSRDYIETLMRDVGRTYSHLLEKEVEVDNEFAIACYNYYAAHIMCNMEELKATSAM